ncbi:hypothetical protein IMSAGC017_00209 [Thomasclavelia cocleata]|uniref:ORC1/DEAH AAA+ ATPase domain-containing protein n=2 Tax=Thomasclavelia cocleata TaxID=69824 RepID=A0A829Z9T1_9FIRM|nr:ATP-binding protein [Thomasclavelia cocleata]GFI40178.1 hypothetical protein IMSAGC017_00209 [Thomasclavelia cocleata]
MARKTETIGTDPNRYSVLKNELGQYFEDQIFNLTTLALKKYLNMPNKKIFLKQTPRIGDNGKDITIKSKININDLFLQNFQLHNKNEINIYIECKSTNQKMLTFNSIITNVIKSKYDYIDYFVLVTNSSIIPETYLSLYKELKSQNIEFILVDQYILSLYVHQLNFKELNLPLYNNKVNICLKYQVLQTKLLGKVKYKVFMLFRNYTEKMQFIDIKLLTNENWIMSDNTNIKILVSPYSSMIKEYDFEQVSYDGVDDLKVLIDNEEYDGNPVFSIKGINIQQNFITPFLGENHNDIKTAIIKSVRQAPSFIYIWGEAGIGKSRIIEEIDKELDGSNFDIKYIELKQNNDKSIKYLKNDLIKNNIIEDNISDNLIDILKNSKNDYRNIIIIIDDFHNANLKTIRQIRELNKVNLDISIIICGRNDYSEGTSNYYSFIQWTLENKRENTYEVKHFKSKDTMYLIKTLINNIPTEALKKISICSKNNPQFIIQFIEYLLETDIVKIVNRNTLGIINIDSFNSKNFIPNKLENLYSCRLNNLLNSFDNDNYVNLLFLLSVFDGKISSSILSNYFKNYDILIEELVKRRYIKFGEMYTVKFTHESQLVFFTHLINKNRKYKETVANIIINNKDIFFDDLSNEKIGRLYLWIKEFNSAKQSFNTIIQQVKNTSNISNFNIDTSIYKYLFDIYELFKNDKNNMYLLEQILKTRVYIALHHLTPIKAIEDCNKCYDFIKKNRGLKSNIKFINSIKSLQAHALLNAGHLLDGELILKELLSTWLINNDDFESHSFFDVLDRLSAIYIKYNCFELAENYNKLEIMYANNLQDDSLLAIAYRTKSKLYFYQDGNKAKDCLEKVSNLYINSSSERIQLSNQLSILIYEMHYNDNCNWQEIKTEAEKIKDNASKKSYDMVLIRSYMILAVCYLKLSKNNKDLRFVKKLIDDGISASIRLGIPGYIWQFYNLLAIVFLKLKKDSNEIFKVFETIYYLLFEQNLLYIGNRLLCFGNIMVISNIGFFYQKISEKAFNEKMSTITYSGNSLLQKQNKESLDKGMVSKINQEYLKKQFKLAENKDVLFVDKTSLLSKNQNFHFLIDDETHYFIVLS